MVGDVVFPDDFVRDGVVLDGLVVVVDAVVEPTDFEGDVLVEVEQVVLRPHPLHASSHVLLELVPAAGDLVENGVSVLVENIRVPVRELEDGEHGLE